MTSKKFNREQIQRCLDVLEQLAQSGLPELMDVVGERFERFAQGDVDHE